MADLRYVRVPKPIKLADHPDPKKPPVMWSFYECIKHLSETDSRYLKTIPGGRAADRMLKEFKDKEGVVVIDEEDRKLLAEIMEAPEQGWAPRLTRTFGGGVPALEITPPAKDFLTFADCLTEENTKKPEEESKEEEDKPEEKKAPSLVEKQTAA